MLYDAGQIVGGFVGGMVSDKMGVRSPVVVVMLLFSWYGRGKPRNVVLAVAALLTLSVPVWFP